MVVILPLAYMQWAEHVTRPLVLYTIFIQGYIDLFFSETKVKKLRPTYQSKLVFQLALHSFLNSNT